jgi:flagellar hook-basal body complex protein FliE
MSIEAMASVASAPLNLIAPTQLPAMNGTATGGMADGVFDALVEHIQSLNDAMSQAAPAAQALALGHTDQMETVLLGLERVRVQFDFMMSVRNRLLESYQEMLRMQV